MASTKTDILKSAMLTALRGELGNVSKACELVDCSRDQHYTWMKSDEDYKAKVEAIKENAIDFVEGQLFKLIKGVTLAVQGKDGIEIFEQPPCKTSIIFYLKTIGKKRGYIERTEIGGPDNGPINIIISPNL